MQYRVPTATWRVADPCACHDRVGLQITHRDLSSRRSLLALRASSRLESESPAWSILRERLGIEDKPGAPPEEHAMPVAPVLMMPSSGNMLFSSLDSQRQRPTSLVGSILVHVIAGAVVLFGFAYKPPITRVVETHYTLRQLDLLLPPDLQKPAPPRIPYPK